MEWEGNIEKGIFGKKDFLEKKALVELVGNLEAARPFICYKLVSRYRNKGLLDKMPYVPWLDIAAVFYISITVKGRKGQPIPVDYGLMQKWGIKDTEKLYVTAHANTQRIFPGRIRPMEEMFPFFAGNGGEGWQEQAKAYQMAGLGTGDKIPLYVATNAKMLNGACVILYDGLLRSFADRIGKNLYIIPSSVHEMLVVPENMAAGAESHRNILQEVNQELADDEVLSGNIYYYDRAGKDVVLA